jgi:hypothetical protein
MEIEEKGEDSVLIHDGRSICKSGRKTCGAAEHFPLSVKYAPNPNMRAYLLAK